MNTCTAAPKPRKFWLGLLMCALALVVCAPMLTGCASPEDAVRKAATSYLDQLKNPDLSQEDFEQYMGTETASTFESYGIDAVALGKSLTKHFDYKINQVTVDGDEANVVVDATNIDFAALGSSLQPKFLEWASSAEAQELIANNDQEGVMKKLFSMLQEELDADSVSTVTNPVTVTFTKSGDDGAPLSSQQISEVLFAGQNPADMYAAE